MAATIVVGVDGSPDSGAALDWAATAAYRRGANLRILHALYVPFAVVPFAGPTVVSPATQLRESAAEVLNQAAHMVHRRAPGVGVTTSIVMGRPSDALISASDEAMLVVVGTRGLSALGALALGSVSARVAAHAHCPTVVVPWSESELESDGSIVVGVDGSPHGDTALRYALIEAARGASKVVAVHSYRTPTVPMPVLGNDLNERIVPAEHDYAEAIVRDAVGRAAHAGFGHVDVTIRVVAGRPADVITEAARDSAMTIVGTRGLGDVRSVLLGSVSRSVLHHSTHPVIVVPSGGV